MAKGFFYKIISDVKEEYGRKRQLDVPEISHNIPESMIVDFNELHSRTKTYDGYFTRTYVCITKEVFDTVVAQKLIWPTEHQFVGGDKLGTAIVRCKNGDIITYFSHNTKTNDVLLCPAFYFGDTNSSYWYEKCMGRLPKRNIKIFMTKEEYEEDKLNKSNKAIEKRAESNKKSEEVRSGAPTFSLKTPEFRIVKIVKKTDWIPDIKEGDKIYGEIPVIENKNGRLYGMLHGGMSYSNYVHVYVNGKCVRAISPLTFQDLFLNNYTVEAI